MSTDARIINELRKGNTEILKGLPPMLLIRYGLALQQEAEWKVAGQENKQDGK